MRSVRLALVTALALLIALPMVAAEKPKRERMKLSPVAQAMMRMVKTGEVLKQLDLTAEQEEKLKGIREETGPKMTGIFDKMKEIVTEDQRKAAEEAAKEAREAGKEGRDFFLAVESAVQLTDEQREKLDKLAPEIQAVQREMMKSVMALLTPEQRKKLAELRSGGKKKPKKAE